MTNRNIVGICSYVLACIILLCFWTWVASFIVDSTWAQLALGGVFYSIQGMVVGLFLHVFFRRWYARQMTKQFIAIWTNNDR